MSDENYRPTFFIISTQIHNDKRKTDFLIHPQIHRKKPHITMIPENMAQFL